MSQLVEDVGLLWLMLEKLSVVHAVPVHVTRSSPRVLCSVSAASWHDC